MIGHSLTLYEPKMNEVDTTNCIHHVSVLSGILLLIGMGSFTCLIPQHNILEEPYYWYESMLLSVLPWGFLVTGGNILGLAYYANMTYAKNLKSFLIVFGIVACLCSLSNVAYYFIWKYALQLTPPMPYNGWIMGLISCTAIYAALWYR